MLLPEGEWLGYLLVGIFFLFIANVETDFSK